MKVGIDATVLVRKNKTGIDFYTRGITKSLAALNPKDDFLLCFFKSEGSNTGIEASNIHNHPITSMSFAFYRWLHRLMIPPALDQLAGAKTDVFFFPNYFIYPTKWTKKTVVVIHDLAFKRKPETFPTLFRLYMSTALFFSLRKASKIIAVSQSTKDDLVDLYKIDPSRIEIAGPAVDRDFFKPAKLAQIKELRDRLGIKRKYILCLGTLEPRKNLIGAMRAYALLPDHIKNAYTLVITGGKGWRDQEIQSEFEKISRTHSVIKTGYLAEIDLPVIYSGASIFLYPSHYEGFGMPPLEAMACGTPVITSNNSSLPEVVGSAGITVDSNDTHSLSESIGRVLGDPVLAKQMSAKGVKQAAKFKWEDSARKLKEVFEEVVGL